MVTAHDFPKLESPFIREEVNGNYVCIPKINEDYRWVFQSGEVTAVEKLDGTNTSIIIENGEIKSIYNRLNKIPFFKKGHARFYEGIQNALEKEYISIEKLKDGQYFGELCGPKINGNPLKLDTHIWFPFDFLIERDKFKFWDKFVETLVDKNDESRKRNFQGIMELRAQTQRKKRICRGDRFL